MNQDGLENFFGNIKSACQTKKQPMAFQFRSAYTNLIVNNLTAKHSIGSNCQDDKSSSLLQDVYDLYDMDCEESEDELDDDVELVVDNENVDSSFLEEEALVFESSKVCRNVLLSTKCTSCKYTLEAHSLLSQHGIIEQCNIPSNTENQIFTYPTLLFMSNFKLLFKKVQVLLPFICHENLLSRKLMTILDSDELVGLGCPEHSSDISRKIKKATVKLNIDMFKKEINDILRKKTLQPVDNQHDIYNKAFKTIKRKKGVGKYGQSPL